MSPEPLQGSKQDASSDTTARQNLSNGTRPIRFGLRTKMALSFGALFTVILLLVSLIRTFGMPWTSDKGSFGDARTQVLRQLSLFADLEKDRLLIWLDERKSDAASLAESRQIASLSEDLLELVHKNANLGASADKLRNELLTEQRCKSLTDALRAVTESHKLYQKIQVVELGSGLVMASTEVQDLGARLSQDEILSGPSGTWDKVSVTIAKSKGTGKPCLLVSHPILDEPAPSRDAAPKAFAMVIMYVDEDQFAKPLEYSGVGIGETEDVVLVDKDRRLLLSPKYALLNGTRVKPLEYKTTAEPALLAIQGKEGIGESGDYRGVPVLAAYRHIRVTPDTGWGLVVKVDQAEILGPTRQRYVHATLISLLGVLAASVMATFIAGRIARPIQDLSLAARRVESGDLTARAALVGSDEVGNLAATFNSMVERIQNWRRDLEEQVKSRTLRLTELNENLTKEITDRTRAEERIREQNEFLATVLESLSYPFYVINVEDYTIKMANSAASLGKASAGATCYALTHSLTEPCGAKDHNCPLDEVRRTGRPSMAEHTHYDSYGAARTVEVHAHPIFDSQGRVIQVIEVPP